MVKNMVPTYENKVEKYLTDEEFTSKTQPHFFSLCFQVHGKLRRSRIMFKLLHIKEYKI